MSATTSSKPWADGPWELLPTPGATKDTTSHPAHHIADIMAHAHNAMLRGLNAIYLQAPSIPRLSSITKTSTPCTDISDFLFFMHSYCLWVLDHHHIEEDIMFPEIRATMHNATLFADEISEHKAFEDGIRGLLTYAEDKAHATVEGYDGAEIQRIVESFAAAYRAHLASEIPTLWALDVADPQQAKALLQTLKNMEKEAMKQNSFTAPPLALRLVDHAYEDGRGAFFPQIPRAFVWLVNYGFAWRYRGAWRFCPGDGWGGRRELLGLVGVEEGEGKEVGG